MCCVCLVILFDDCIGFNSVGLLCCDYCFCLFVICLLYFPGWYLTVCLLCLFVFALFAVCFDCFAVVCGYAVGNVFVF